MNRCNVHLFPNRVGGFQNGVPFAWAWRRRAYVWAKRRRTSTCPGLYMCVYMYICIPASTLMDSLLEPSVSVCRINTDRLKFSLYHPFLLLLLPPVLFSAACNCWLIRWWSNLAGKNRVGKWGNTLRAEREVFFSGQKSSTETTRVKYRRREN